MRSSWAAVTTDSSRPPIWQRRVSMSWSWNADRSSAELASRRRSTPGSSFPRWPTFAASFDPRSRRTWNWPPSGSRNTRTSRRCSILSGSAISPLPKRSGVEPAGGCAVLEGGREGAAPLREILGRVRGAPRADVARTTGAPRRPSRLREHSRSGGVHSPDPLHVDRGGAGRVLRIGGGEGIPRDERSRGDDGRAAHSRHGVRLGPPYARRHRRPE